MLKQSAYRPEGWQHLMLEGLKGFTPNLKIMNFACSWLARAQSLWVKSKIRTGDRPVDQAPEAKFLHNHDL